MPKMIRCPCEGNPKCKQCGGTGKYAYEPGPRGWLPISCPTCEGKKQVMDDSGKPMLCFTCHGQGSIDPANPPSKGLFDLLWKTLFGA